MSPRRVATDREALAGLAWGEAAGGDELVEAAWEEGLITATWRREAGGPLTVRIEPRDEQRPRFRRTPQLNLSYQGERIDDRGIALIEGLVDALGATSFEALWDRLEALPHEERAAAAGGTPLGDADDGTLVSAAGRWGREELGDQFLAEKIRQGAPLQLADPIAAVMHAEFECAHVHGAVPWTPFRPFVESRGSPLPYPVHRRAPGPLDTQVRGYLTDLSQRDAVQGRGNRKLRGVLEALAGDPWFAAVYFNATCVPTVLGDDVQGPLAAFRGACERPLIFESESRHDEFASLGGLLRERAEAAPVGEAGRAGVALVGYAEDTADDPLAALLDELAIPVAISTVPVLRLDDVDAVLRARVQVLRPDPHYEDLYEGVFGGLPVPAISPAPPFGVAATARWVRTVAGALERDIEDPWRRHLEPRAATWEGLHRRATEHRLLFVLRLPQLRRLLRAERQGGVPVLAMAQEMGFGLALAIRAGTGDPEVVAATARREVDAALAGGGVAVTTYPDAAAIPDLLRGTDCSAAYSEFPRDVRLIRAGLGRVSWTDATPAVDGAIRTLRRWLRVCEAPFHRRYRDHLDHGRAGDER